MVTRQALFQAAEIISRKWTETPYLDAQVMLQEISGLSREKLLAMFSEEIPDPHFQKLMKMAEKRAEGYPVAYLTGKKEFYGRTFSVDENVLVPRADTEIIVEKTCTTCEKLVSDGVGPVRVLDLCTGTGCIAITLKCELDDNIEVEASDISAGAKNIFYRNCRDILGYTLDFTESSLFDNIRGKYHVIVSNPPYLEDSHVRQMFSIGWPEPELALAGGSDGLDFIRKIVRESPAYLYDGGALLIEADPSQMEAAGKLFAENNFSGVEIYRDLPGRERVITGWKKQEYLKNR